MIVEQQVIFPAHDRYDDAGRKFTEPQRVETIRLFVDVDAICRTLGAKASFSRGRKAQALRGLLKVRAL